VAKGYVARVDSNIALLEEHKREQLRGHAQRRHLPVN
jgi:hypothetical protein